MTTVNVHHAKTHLSKLLEAIESGAESEIVIARNGKPVARLTSVTASAVGARIGVAKGKYADYAFDPDVERAMDGEVEALFDGASDAQ